MNSFNREQYLKQLRMYYSGDRNDTEQFLEEMSDSLDCYLKEHPSATTVEIFHHFGHPKELEEQYEEAVAAQHREHKKKFFKTVIIAIFAACLLILGAFILHSCEILNEVNGHSEVIIKEKEIKNEKPDNPSPSIILPSDNPQIRIID
ncbi:hypothetical protein [Jutongia sp.]|uniref:hypothetical protein n=1 Tax=Jutongia sp. TaxID=2944204 RepID=UPI00307B076A